MLWAATVVGNTGTFMRDVASSWITTDLSAQPRGGRAAVQPLQRFQFLLLAISSGGVLTVSSTAAAS